jgi:hypothetical protein
MRFAHDTQARLAMIALSATLIGGVPASVARSSDAPSDIAILSVSDVKGKTSPCGCHTPKGGLSRQASFIDSVRASGRPLLILDNGGFFPEEEVNRETTPFLMGMMRVLGFQAVGVAPRDLHFGLGFFRAQLKQSGLTAVCANLIDRQSGAPLVEPSIIVPVGRAKVGVFGLIDAQAELPALKDSLRLEDPAPAARREVADLRRKGATVVVLLSQLGKAESEDLVASVDGIDAVIVGHMTPMVEKGQTIQRTVAVYGGEQGQYMGVTLLHLDSAGRSTGGRAWAAMLSPTVGENPRVLKLVKQYEDSFNEKQRKAQEAQAAAIASGADTTDHFVGGETCVRCHPSEAAQWKTTDHARAWQTLVDEKKDATPDCIACHSVGYRQPGGFVSATRTPQLENVQCESCHGMGTRHDSYAAAHTTVAEGTCRACHNATTSPTFDFAVYKPHVAHHFKGQLPPIPESPARKMMSTHGH